MQNQTPALPSLGPTWSWRRAFGVKLRRCIGFESTAILAVGHLESRWTQSKKRLILNGNAGETVKTRSWIIQIITRSCNFIHFSKPLKCQFNFVFPGSLPAPKKTTTQATQLILRSSRTSLTATVAQHH